MFYSYIYEKINEKLARFMYKLYDKDREMFRAFIHDLGNSYDDEMYGGFGRAIGYIIIYSILVLTIIALIVLVICQLRSKCTKRKNVRKLAFLSITLSI